MVKSAKVVMLVMVAAIAVTIAPRIASADSSCPLPSGTGCSYSCGSCQVEFVFCSYETDCYWFSDSPCSAGDDTLNSSGCGLFGTQHQCQRSAWVNINQCASCQPNYFGADCEPCPRGANGYICSGIGTCSDGIYGDGSCSCPNGYTGSVCQYSRATCSNRGNPNYDGSCTCDSGYAGATCESCATDYYPTSYGGCMYCSASTTCSGHGLCGGNGTCVCDNGFTGPNCNECKPDYYNYPACTYCQSQYTCSGNGSCSTTGQCVCQAGTIGPNCSSCADTSQCAGYYCIQGRCEPYCGSNLDCAPGYYCDGQCYPQLENGQRCSYQYSTYSPPGICKSGHCVDGVCCDTSCTGQCERCEAPGSIGTCTPTVGTPIPLRPFCNGDRSSCTGYCNGINRYECQFPDATTACRSPSCTNGIQTNGARCDGSGDCGPLVQSSCGEYACGATTCDTTCASLDDCAASAFCSNGVCEADTEPPVVTFDLPPLTNQPLALTAQLTDNGRVASAQLLVNNTAVSATVDLTADTLSIAALPLQEGVNTVLVSATDRAGNVGGHQVQVTRDTTAPAITVMSPTPGQAIGTPSVAVTVSITDASASSVTIGTNTFSLAAGGGVASTTISFASAGLQTIPVTAVDAAGNTSSGAATVLVDLDAPVVGIDVVGGAMYGPLPDGLLPVTIHVDDVAATTVALGSQTFSLARGGGVVQAAVPLVEGSNTIAVSVTSETGRMSTLSRTVFYDTTPPTSVLRIPADGSFLAGSLELTADVADVTSGIGSVAFQIDDGPPLTALSTNGFVWMAALDTTQIADGPHTITATAIDRVGNSGSVHATVTIDNTAPTAAVVSPTGGSYVHSTISVQASAADQFGIVQIAVTANGAPIGSCPVATSCTLSYDTTSNPDGSLLLSAVATDRAGNHSAPATIDVTSVNHIPASFIASPTQGAIVSGAFTVQVSVADPYFASVTCSVGGASLGASTNPNFTTTIDTTSMLDGSLAVSCMLTDLAGNTSTQGVTVTVKNWTIAFAPQILNLKSGASSVTLTIEGQKLAQLLPASQLALVVPGGSPVPYTGPSVTTINDADHDGIPDLVLAFDRAKLEASIRAGIAAGAIDPAAAVPVHVYASGHDLGSTSIQVKE